MRTARVSLCKTQAGLAIHTNVTHIGALVSAQTRTRPKSRPDRLRFSKKKKKKNSLSVNQDSPLHSHPFLDLVQFVNKSFVVRLSKDEEKRKSINRSLIKSYTSLWGSALISWRGRNIMMGLRSRTRTQKTWKKKKSTKSLQTTANVE